MENFFSDFTYYDQYAPHLIPGYEEIQSNIVNNLKKWINAPAVVLDIGCGTGYTIEKIIEHYHDVNIIGVDGSPAMAAQAKQRLSKYPSNRWKVYTQDILHLPDTPPLQAALSIATLNNIEEKYTDLIYKEIYSRLTHGGGFIHADFIAHESGLVNALIEKAYNCYVESHVPTDFFTHWLEHSASDYYPLTLTQHVHKLEAVGFSNISLLWLKGNFAIFSALKT